MIRTAIGAALAAFVMFVWGFLFWGMNVAGDPFDRYASLEQEAAIAAALKANTPAPGTYVIPYAMQGEDTMGEAAVKASTERHKAGPIAWISYEPQGCDPMGPTKMPLGYAHMLLTAIMLAVAMRMAKEPSWSHRFTVGLSVAVAVTVWSNLRQPIWFHAPLRHHMVVAVYDLVAWSLASLVLAGFTAPDATSAEGTKTSA